MTRMRRICWPPDLTCLEGGCGYCEDHPFRSHRTILDWVLANPRARHRNGAEWSSTMNAFQYGAVRSLRHLWKDD